MHEYHLNSMCAPNTPSSWLKCTCESPHTRIGVQTSWMLLISFRKCPMYRQGDMHEYHLKALGKANMPGSWSEHTGRVRAHIQRVKHEYHLNVLCLYIYFSRPGNYARLFFIPSHHTVEHIFVHQWISSASAWLERHRETPFVNHSCLTSFPIRLMMAKIQGHFICMQLIICLP